MNFLLRLLLNALALMVAAYFVPGLTLTDPGAAIVAAIVVLGIAGLLGKLGMRLRL